MADEPNKDHPEDIQSILSDLDAILTDMGGGAKSPPATPPPTPPAAEVKLPPKTEAPKIETPKVEAPKAATPPPPPPPPPSIELAPREGHIVPPPPAKPVSKPVEAPPPIELTPTPAPKAPEPVKAAAPPPPPPPSPPPPPPAAPPPAPPSPTAVPAPAAAVPSTAIEALPPDTPKEQIRRVAYVFTSNCGEAKAALAAFLSQSARTISKKPLFLREVLAHEVGGASDPNAVVEKARQVKAVAVLAVVEGWSAAKVDELSEACSRASLLFRAVAPGDTQKKSTAVDIIVDMMLLPGEG